MMKKTGGTIFLPNGACVALWKHELTGQLSDGMWENTAPYDHWRFWCNLHAVATSEGSPQVISQDMWKCKKTGYNFAALYPIVGDRMLRKAKMGLHTTNEGAIRAAEYMPATLNEFRTRKVTGSWEHSWTKEYMDQVTDEVAVAFYSTSYTMRDLRHDIASIKAAMKTVKRF